MQKRRKPDLNISFETLMENMKIESIYDRVETADKKNHVTMDLARKLAGSHYIRNRNVKSFLTFEKELREEVYPRYRIKTPPKTLVSYVKILKKMYDNDYTYMRIIAVNSFNALLDQFTSKDNMFPNVKELKTHFYKILFISICLSNQTLPDTNSIHKICVWIYACIFNKTDDEIKSEVERFLKDPIPPVNGKIRENIIELYNTKVSDMEFLRMIRYAEVFRSANVVRDADITIPNDIIMLVQEYNDVVERIKDRYRYYMDKYDIENQKVIDAYLSKHKVKL